MLIAPSKKKLMLLSALLLIQSLARGAYKLWRTARRGPKRAAKAALAPLIALPRYNNRSHSSLSHLTDGWMGFNWVKLEKPIVP